jgi:hypothetical protein
MDDDTQALLTLMLETQRETAETLAEAVTVLHAIETMLDVLVTVAEETNDSARTTAYRSLGIFGRWRASWHHAKSVIDETTAEEELRRILKLAHAADEPDDPADPPPLHWLK